MQGHLGPQREIVAKELHDERGVLVRLTWSVYLPLGCPSIFPWVVFRVGHLGPQREVVAQELHDERGVLVRLFAQRVEVRDRVVERLPRAIQSYPALLLLSNTLSLRFCGGVDFPQLINKYLCQIRVEVRDRVVESLPRENS
jgi:hypothetical protein